MCICIQACVVSLATVASRIRRDAWAQLKQAFAITKTKCRNKVMEEWYSTEFLGLDEALHVFDQPDVKIVQAGQKSEAAHAEKRRQWTKSYVKLASTVHAKRSKGVVDCIDSKRNTKRTPVSVSIPQ